MLSGLSDSRCALKKVDITHQTLDDLVKDMRQTGQRHSKASVQLERSRRQRTDSTTDIKVVDYAEEEGKN